MFQFHILLNFLLDFITENPNVFIETLVLKRIKCLIFFKNTSVNTLFINYQGMDSKIDYKISYLHTNPGE